MKESWFPTLSSLPASLSRDIAEVCGGSACPELFNKEPHALRIMLLLALLPGLSIQKIKDAFPDTAITLKRLRAILDIMQAKGMAYQSERAYLLRNMPTSSEMQNWVQTPAFETLRNKVQQLAQNFIYAEGGKEGTEDDDFVWSGRASYAAYIYNNNLDRHQAPEFLSPGRLARMLRLCDMHKLAYRILQIFAEKPNMLNPNASEYTPYSNMELRATFCRLLGHNLEDASSLPADMQAAAARDNIQLKSLTRRADDTFMSHREHVRALYERSVSESLLCSLIFHDLQAGRWDGIALLSCREDAPYDTVQLALKLCKWKSENNWKHLKGILKNFSGGTALMLAPFISIANKVNKISMKGVLDALRYTRSGVFGKTPLLLSNNLENLSESEYKQELCTWQTESPIALLPLLLSAMTTGATRTDKSIIQAAVEACFTLHGRGLTVYSWYMANILGSLPTIAEKDRAQLRDIIASRTDLPPLPGITIYASAEDMLLKKFLELAGELSSSNSSTTQADSARLEWRIEASTMGYVTGIIPILRKRTTKGTLSSGRQVSLDSLAKGKYDDCITSEDKSILSQVRHEYSYYENYYYLPCEAAGKLCGHPHVRVLINGEETLQAALTLKSPRLLLKETGGKLEIKLPADAGRVRLERTGECAFNLYMPTPGVNKMKHLLQSTQEGNKLQLPMSARSEITQALRALAGHFT